MPCWMKPAEESKRFSVASQIYLAKIFSFYREVLVGTVRRTAPTTASGMGAGIENRLPGHNPIWLPDQLHSI